MSWRLAARSTSLVWSLALAAFVLAGAVVLLGSVADQARGPVVKVLREATGLPLAIDALGLGWQGLNPTVTLQGLRLESDTPLAAQPPWLQAEEVAVAWEWGDVLRGRLHPHRLRIDDATLRLTEEARAWWAGRARDQPPPVASMQLAFRDLRIVQPATERVQLRSLEIRSGWLDWQPAENWIEGQAKAAVHPGGRSDSTPAPPVLIDLEGQWRDHSAWLRFEGLGSGIADAPVVAVQAQRTDRYWQGAVGPAHELAQGTGEVWFNWISGDAGVQWVGDTVPLSVLAPLARTLMPFLPQDWVAEGDLRDIRGDWRWQPDPDQARLSLQARLSKVGFDGPAFEITGLDGFVALDERGGYFQPATAAPGLRLSGWAQPLALDALQGNWIWSRHADGSWRLAAPELTAQALGASVSGHLFAIAGGGLPLEVDLGLDLDAADIARAHPYWPEVWPPSLRSWLESAVLAGRLDQGRLEIGGPLVDFPFVDRPTGQWQLTLPLTAARLKFAPDWPAATQVDGVARFAGNSLTVDAARGRLGAVAVGAARAEIAALNRQSLLEITAEARDQAGDFLDLLATSPLRQRFSGLIDGLSPQGPAAVTLRLAIPLAEINATRAAGSIQLQGNQIKVAMVDAPLSAVTGRVAFEGEDLSGTLAGRWQEAPVGAVLEGDAQGARVSLTGAALPVSSLAQWVPAPVLETLAGELDWAGELALPREGPPMFTATSSLEGVTVGMPQPLIKSAAEIRPLRLRVPLDDAAGQGAILTVGDDWVRGRFHPNRTELRVGPASEALSGVWGDGDGLWFAADLDTVAADDWVAWLGGFKGATASSRTALAGGVLQAQTLTWGLWSLAGQGAVLNVHDAGWRIQLDGAASGTVERFSGGHLAQLEALALTLSLPLDDDGSAPVPRGAPADDRQPLPEGLLGSWTGQVERFELNGLDLGQLVLTGSVSARDAMQFDLALQNGRIEGAGQFGHDGVLRVSRGQFETQDPAVVLQAFDRAPPFEARRAGMSWTLAWPASATRLAIPSAEGDMTVWMREGQLRAVDPGAGRLLGLFSFYQLPKRFLLDFRDVTDEGMHFDSLNAGLRIDRGRVVIDDMVVRTPSLRMTVAGETHLLTRELDQRVTVYPDYTGGASLGAALLGGPAVGILVLLAQTLLDKPLDAAGQFGYRISGTWEAPEITRFDLGRAASPTAESP